MVEKNQTLRWTSAVVENFLFCGFLLGWHMLQNVFVDEGFFCNAESQLREVKISNFFRKILKFPGSEHTSPEY